MVRPGCSFLWRTQHSKGKLPLAKAGWDGIEERRTESALMPKKWIEERIYQDINSAFNYPEYFIFWQLGVLFTYLLISKHRCFRADFYEIFQFPFNQP